MNLPFKKTNILLPKKDIDLNKWAVIACDQYTSNQKYWDVVDEIVGDAPSTLKITLPEIYLEQDGVEDRIKNINNTMDKYIEEGILEEYEDTLLYIERIQSDGNVREGIIGMIDLEDYDYSEGSKSLIRATEKTIVERIPPRVKIRENASLELPHIMILIDDENKEIIETIKSNVNDNDVVYDFDLMKNSGHLKGYKLNDEVSNNVLDGLNKLMDKNSFNKKYNTDNEEVLLFAMGDGNHSLATAKKCYEDLKKNTTPDEYLNSKARYALVEIVNLHSNALQFESIQRVVFDVDADDIFNKLKEYYNLNTDGNGEKFVFVNKNGEQTYYISNPKSNLAVGSIQIFLDEYLKNNGGRIDYIHEAEEVRELIKDSSNVGFIFEPMKKNELFKTVILDGALPRKTFSMGHSDDKRFYLESRKIKDNK